MSPDPVALAELAALVGGRVVGDPVTPVHDVSHDSRRAGPGVLFVAVRGFTVDGHRFVAAARAAGAAAVCVEEDPGDGGPALLVTDTRAVLGPLAARVHGDPSHRLRLVGVTGTNGKTTVTHLLESIAGAAGLAPALVGTVGARIAGVPEEVLRTTPEAPDFQRLLARMVSAGVEVAAVEVSSHALALGRVAGSRFAVAAFTNLSRDHLDFHPDMEAYYRAKASLFSPEMAEQAVIWVDDPAGERLASETALSVTRVGLRRPAAVSALDPAMGLRGSSFILVGAGEPISVRLNLAGEFNLANALVAAGVAAVLGIPSDSIAAGIGAVTTVPGRFEIVETEKDCTVVVDYAHTPDGVAVVIETARRLAGPGRVIAVVGAGGDRDRAKRPLMGAAAAGADLAFITSDNPRSEDPGAIIEQVVAGAAGGPAELRIEADRRLAIRAALSAARRGDVVLILGKGHEQGQQFADRVIPFDDRLVAREEAAR
ncbi:MAG TPA: UDP-N-acetylmuramoyl-L-alanyl-D-glutamate--2,6-diaminopimelate ligase [Acidimicrobiia bacterium]|nr:UDP-N-acetylmuramoyl-L-alanyl-D-glutamate--2,6-diaminopimelate ligase [Acidimicrobiia bacterium]